MPLRFKNLVRNNICHKKFSYHKVNIGKGVEGRGVDGGGGVDRGTNLFIRARVEPPELEVTVSTGGRGEDGDTGLSTLLLTASISHH